MLRTAHVFKLYGKLGEDHSAFSDSLSPNKKIRLRLIRARTNFYKISDNPNLSLGMSERSISLVVCCSQGPLSQKKKDWTNLQKLPWSLTIWTP